MRKRNRLERDPAEASPARREGRKPPTASEICDRLRRLGSRRGLATAARFGIPTQNAYGIDAPALCRLAREIGRDHRLAAGLWNTGVREARLLAALIEEPKQVSEAQAERWARAFNSWDMVDNVCRYLLLFTPFAWKKTREWSRRREEFVKRAAFSLMAYLAIHDHDSPDRRFLPCLEIIRREASDPRLYVRKGVNWALRQIGKRSLMLRRRALAVAVALKREPATRWVGADAARELSSAAVIRRLALRQA
jgi:3-methyladenine DNA glycosylase AlkD